MLLQGGWCYSTSVLADDIAMVVDLKPHRVIIVLADVKAICGWCCMATVSIYFNFEFWDVKQNLIPNMWQMVLANVSIKGWIISSDK